MTTTTDDTITSADTAKAAANRITRISQTMRTEALPVLEAADVSRQASDVLKAAGTKATSTRMETILALAAASQHGQWMEPEIRAAIGETVAGTNGGEDGSAIKTMKTFLGECREAMMPAVRSHAPHLVELLATAWLREAGGDTDDDKPIKKAFKRQYHATIYAFRLAATGRLLTIVEEVTAWAVENDPDLDYKQVARRLETIHDTIKGFMADFPVPGLEDVSRYLDNIDKKALKAARESVVGAAKATENARLDGHRLAPTLGVAAQPSKPAPVATPAPATISAAFSDPADDVLGIEPDLETEDHDEPGITEEVLADLHALQAA